MRKTVKEYIEMGFEPRMAAYFASGRHRAVSVIANHDFTVTVSFDDGACRLYDMKPSLREGTVFASFTSWDNFSRVYVDESGAVCWDIDPTVDSNVVWNNKIDISPDTMYVYGTPTDEKRHA